MFVVSWNTSRAPVSICYGQLFRNTMHSFTVDVLVVLACERRSISVSGSLDSTENNGRTK